MNVGITAGTAGGVVLAGTAMAVAYTGWGWLQWGLLIVGLVVLAAFFLVRASRTTMKNGDDVLPPDLKMARAAAEAGYLSTSDYIKLVEASRSEKDNQ